MANTKKLYRSEQNRMVGGVAGGLAEYFEFDPTLVRLGFILTTFMWGGGLWIYLAMWLIVPSKSNMNSTGNDALNKNVAEMKDSARKAGDFVKDKVEEAKHKDA